MKPNVYKVLIFAAVATVSLFSSCLRDADFYPESGDGDGIPAILSFSPLLDDAVTRAGYPGDPDELEPGDGADDSDAMGSDADHTVSSLKVLMYESNTGVLVEDLDFEIDELNPFPVTAEVLTGKYDFYFIANRDVEGASLRDALDAAEATVSSTDLDDFDVSTRWKLERLLFVAGSSPTLKDLEVPMIEVVRGVTVKGDNLIRLAGAGADTSGIWPVTLTRAFMRLSLDITLTPAQYANLEDNHVVISRVPSAVFVMQGKINDPSGETDGGDSFTLPFKPATEAATDPDLLYGIVTENRTGADITSYTVRFDRVILPELLFADKGNADKAMLLSMDFDGGSSKKGRINLPLVEGAEDYTIPRNTWLHLDVTVKDDELLIKPNVVVWNGAVLEDVLVVGDYFLETDSPEMLFLAGGGPGSVGVRTNAPDGWEVETSVATPEWLTISAATMSGASIADFAPIEASAVSNATGAVREGTFIVTAYGGRLRKTITVTQLTNTDTPAPDNVDLYVGAFWKHDQTGERLIRVARPAGSGVIDGEWSASVVSGHDWIVLDKMMTDDPNVGWLPGASEAGVAGGNDAGFDTMYGVNSTAKWVGGTLDEGTPEGGIFFRIGLRGEIAASEHRYGMVVLSYKINDSPAYQRIFIRQGEGADYLMRDGDPDVGSGHKERNGAAKFIPYNLTAAAMSGSTEYVSLALWGGAPVAYPTQAGAMFQFASSNNPRYAWHPTLFSSSLPGGWDSSTSTVWSADHETCPEGYRRPESGSTRISSEMALSLMADLSSPRDSEVPNSVWGYYADGFFDRRMTGKQTSSAVGGNAPATPHSAVATGTKDVAYVGRLFYNTESGGSLFFPASGMLENSNGVLHHAGSYGHYWSNFATSGTDGRAIGISKAVSIPNPTAEPRSRGYSVRCVQAPPIASDLQFAPPGVVGIRKTDYDKIMAGKLDPLTDKGASYSLTLKGSSTYAKTAVPPAYSYIEDIAAPFGGIEKEPVYMVNFKWGSMIAIVNRAGDTDWSLDDVVWVNPEFTGTLTTTYSSVEAVVVGPNVINPSDSDYGKMLIEKGQGDICAYLTSGMPGGAWRIPAGNPWHGNGGVYPGFVNAYVAGSPKVDTGYNPNDWAVVSVDKSIFLPIEGYRSFMGNDVLASSNRCYYWSSSASRYRALILNIFIDSDTTAYIYNNPLVSPSVAISVRCVQPAAIYKTP